MDVELNGRVVAITGAARGIGLATAQHLVRAGAKVALGDIDEQAVPSAAAQFGDSAIGHVVDVRDGDSFREFLDAAVSEFGALDVLVNNAGIMPVGPFLDESAEDARRMFDVNVHGVLTGMKLAVPLIAHRPGARIVNIASYAGKLAVPGEVSYAGTKAAVIAISAGARWELEPKGIGVTAVMPTFTNTELIAGTAPVKTIVPIEPDDVALAILDSIRTGQDEVYVPKSLKPVGAAFNLIPRRLRQRLYHRMGLDRAFIQVDRDQRKVYSDRIDALR
jgi:NAD(P)-dependent dehydrogenase (short-subunit alcohol dehydrogenase family)